MNWIHIPLNIRPADGRTLNLNLCPTETNCPKADTKYTALQKSPLFHGTGTRLSRNQVNFSLFYNSMAFKSLLQGTTKRSQKKFHQEPNFYSIRGKSFDFL